MEDGKFRVLEALHETFHTNGTNPLAARRELLRKSTTPRSSYDDLDQGQAVMTPATVTLASFQIRHNVL
jgi:hypothetical protein